MGLRDLFSKTSPSSSSSKKSKHSPSHQTTSDHHSSPEKDTRRTKSRQGREVNHFRAPSKSKTWPIEHGRMSRRDTFEAMGGCGRDSSDSIDEDLRKYLNHSCGDEGERTGSGSSGSSDSSHGGGVYGVKKCGEYLEGMNGEIKKTKR